MYVGVEAICSVACPCLLHRVPARAASRTCTCCIAYPQNLRPDGPCPDKRRPDARTTHPYLDINPYLCYVNQRPMKHNTNQFMFNQKKTCNTWLSR